MTNQQYNRLTYGYQLELSALNRNLRSLERANREGTYPTREQYLQARAEERRLWRESNQQLLADRQAAGL